MAACWSLEHIFEKPLPDNPTLLESLSPWKQIKSMKTTFDDSSFTEIFGELHFKESPIHARESSSSPSFSPSPLSSNCFDSIRTHSGIDIQEKDQNEKNTPSFSSPLGDQRSYMHSDSFSSANSENLSLCTERLGFESFDDVEDLLRNENSDENDDFFRRKEESKSVTKWMAMDNHRNEWRTTRTSQGEFPPPISCLGRNGKPWVCFKPYRENGRFILKEVRIPTQEFLHACREDGRLKMKFISSDDEMFEDEEEDDEDENGLIEGENGEENPGMEATLIGMKDKEKEESEETGDISG